MSFLLALNRIWDLTPGYFGQLHPAGGPKVEAMDIRIAPVDERVA